MKEALEMLHVSKNVQDALVEGTGPFAPVIEFIQGYEVANWALIDRVMLMNHLESDSVYVAYIDSLKWFKTLFPEKK